MEEAGSLKSSFRRRPESTSAVDTGLRRCDVLECCGQYVTIEKVFFVYLLASGLRGTLYVGVTSDLLKRIWEHKTKVVPGFTTRYGVDRLIWYERHENAESAIRREKQIKEWKREWKFNLIEQDNPYWVDLYPTLPPR
jgi:putative endonuclease